MKEKRNPVIIQKLKESALSILPIVLIVTVLQATRLIFLTEAEIICFFVSSLVLIIGMSLFSMGADISMTPMGDKTGTSLMHMNRPILLIVFCLLLGFLITVAEPDLSVLAEQIDSFIPGTLLIVTVAAGVGLFLVLAVLKMLFRKPLPWLLLFFYMVLFALSALLITTGSGDFLALAFDSGGVTTGPITVPFLMALGIGISGAVGGKDTEENSFGMIAMCSVGPVLAVLLLGVVSKGTVDYQLPDYRMVGNLFGAYLNAIADTAAEVAISLILISVFFLVLQLFCIKMSKRSLARIFSGMVFTFVGLVLFLSAANVGFMPIGYKIGIQIADSNPTLLIVLGLIIGAVVVLAEPAVHILNGQVESITDGGVKKSSMLVALCCGVGIAIALSMVRIIYDFSILYYVIPGYLLSLGLSFFVPGLYTSIAFDSGGVASGPMTSSFILPFAIGACSVLQSSDKVLTDAFGVVAMVAMTPLITIQMLGFKATVMRVIRRKRAQKWISNTEDEQILRFRN